MTDPIGFLGLGKLGLPMAMHLAEAGHSLAVWNRSAGRADTLAARGARVAARPVDTLAPGGVVISVLWDTDVVERIVTAKGFLERLGAGGVHVCMCTGSPQTARRLAQLHADQGCTYIEAPIFGRPEAAVAKQLWIPVSGPEDGKARVRPLLTAMGAQGIFDFGDQIGAATIVKLAGNFLIISATRSLHEALTMADRNGVDANAVVAMLTQTLFPAPIYRSYGTAIAQKSAPPMQSPIPLKDIGLFEAAARSANMPAPLAGMLHALLEGRTG